MTGAVTRGRELDAEGSAPEILREVQQRLAEHETDLLVLTATSSIAYVLGFRYLSVDRLVWAVIPPVGPAALLVPEYEEAAARAASAQLADVQTWTDADGPGPAIDQVLAKFQSAATIGIENQEMTVADLHRITRVRPDVKFRDLGPVLASMRAVKRPDELEQIRYAAGVLDRTVERFVEEFLRPGTTEAELSAELTRLLRVEGADWTAFPPNVTSGARSAFPHGPDMSSRRGASIGKDPVSAHELVVLDFSAVCGGYCADISRTYVIGEAPARVREAFAIVREAHLAAIDACRPGATGHDVDRAARSIIETHGLGELFPQRTGHGLGLQIHECPDLTAGSRDELLPGMVAAIEPAVYMPGLGGIRNEDVVLIEDGPPTVLTHARSQLELTL